MTELPPDHAAARTFSARDRIRGHHSFDGVFARGTRASSGAMLVLARKNDLAHARLGISVGRKYGNSPRRNRAKRLLRECFRTQREHVAVGFDYVVVPRSEFPDALPAVVTEFLRLAAKAAANAARAPAREPPTS